jgi:hypothetical protein
VVDDRLLHTTDVALERELLRAASEEVPPSATRVRALAALGLLGVATPAAAAASASGATGTAATGALGISSWLMKWGLVIGVAGAAVSGAIALERSVSPATPPAMTQPQPALVDGEERDRSTPSKPPATVDEESAEESAAGTDPAHAPSKRIDSTAKRRSTARAASEREEREADPGGAVSIRDEVRLLDRARAAVARGAGDEALAILASYSARHPKGELREEAAIIKMDALRASGER